MELNARGDLPMLSIASGLDCCCKGMCKIKTLLSSMKLPQRLVGLLGLGVGRADLGLGVEQVAITDGSTSQMCYGFQLVIG